MMFSGIDNDVLDDNLNLFSLQHSAPQMIRQAERFSNKVRQ